MRGFTSVIRDIVRAEIQPKRLEDLLGGRPLRVGLNYAQFFMFDGNQKRKAEGFFPELMRSIGLAVTAPVDFIDVLHTDFQDKLEQGVIDCYGPIYKTASRLSKSLFTIPFCTVPAAALLRVKKAPPLVELPPLRSFSDLQIRPYIVTVHRDSMAHHFAESVLGIHPNRILACELPEESLERIILNKIPRAAHLMLTDLPFAKEASKAHQKDITMFKQSEAEQEASFENCIAVRSDWQPLLGGINQALEYLKRNGAIGRLAERNPSENRDCIDWIP
jgi:ABC-type amino acid transport substrate-binding protein